MEGNSMATYERTRDRVDRVLRAKGIVVVIGKDHVRTPADAVAAVTEIHAAGYVPEITFRIDESILRDAMADLIDLRARSAADDPLILGVGSVINRTELRAAVDLGFDMIVGPANVVGSHGQASEFVREAHAAGVFSVPAAFTPTEFQYYLDREDGLEPDAIKVFPASVYGPDGFAGMLAPFARDRHRDRLVIPTGGVDAATGPEYQRAIRKRGFTPVLGTSAPLALVAERKRPGDPDTIRESLARFKSAFHPA